MYYTSHTRNSRDSVLHAPYITRANAKPLAKGVCETTKRKRKYGDEVILEIRRLKEVVGMKTQQIEDLLRVRRSYINSVLQYSIAGHLCPDDTRTQEPYCSYPAQEQV